MTVVFLLGGLTDWEWCLSAVAQCEEKGSYPLLLAWEKMDIPASKCDFQRSGITMVSSKLGIICEWNHRVRAPPSGFLAFSTLSLRLIHLVACISNLFFIAECHSIALNTPQFPYPLTLINDKYPSYFQFSTTH